MKKRGFTLIELLIVIVIIGILATIIIINYSGAQQAARYSKAKSDLLSIQSAAKLLAADTKENIFHYKLDGAPNSSRFSLANGNAELPIVATNTQVNTGGGPASNLSKRMGLLEKDDSPEYTNWAGPYIDQIPEEDPWGNKYMFDPDYVCNSSKDPDTGEWVLNEEKAKYEYGCQGILNAPGAAQPRIRALVSYGEDSDPGYGGYNVAYQAFSK